MADDIDQGCCDVFKEELTNQVIQVQDGEDTILVTGLSGEKCNKCGEFFLDEASTELFKTATEKKK